MLLIKILVGFVRPERGDHHSVQARFLSRKMPGKILDIVYMNIIYQVQSMNIRASVQAGRARL